MVLQFRDFVRARCGKFGGMRPHRDSAGISYFQASGPFVVSQMLRVLYDGATVSLDRKRALYEEIIATARDARHFITRDPRSDLDTVMRSFLRGVGAGGSGRRSPDIAARDC